MKKYRSLAIILILTLSLTPLFAFQDSFSTTTNNELYGAVISAIKSGESEANVLNAYNAYMAGPISDVERCRVLNYMARYYKDSKNKNEAARYVDEMKRLNDALPSSTSELERLVCNVDTTSADFYVNRSLSVGMKNSDLTKEMYKKYPNEFYAALTEAWRLIYTPSIAGGSPKKAIKILDELTKDANGKLNILDQYTINCAYGIAYNARGDYEKADSYLKKALSVFKGEAEVVQVYEDNLKALKKENEG